MNRSFLTLSPLLALALWACNEDRGEQRPDAERGASLQRFGSCEELREYVAETWTEYLVQSMYGYGYGWDAAEDDAGGEDGESGGGDGPDDYSQTNVQEAGVDEPDLVKTDGEFLYIVQNGELAIVDSWPAAETSLVSTLALEQYPFAMFLSGDRLAVFSHYYEDYGYEGYEDFRSGSAARVTVIDVSDRSAPEVLREVDIEGWYTDARMVGSDIYVVVQAWADMPSELWELAYDESLGLPEYDWEASEEERDDAMDEARSILAPRVADLVAALDDAALLPRYRDQLPGEGAELTELLGCTDVYHTANLSWPSVLTLAHLDLDEGDAGSDVSATGVMADGWTVYASTGGLYVAQTSSSWWSWDGQLPETTTQIHRFSLEEGGSAYEASGEVDGWLLNQFSLSEHEGDLRVATSDGWGWGWAEGGDVAVSEGSSSSEETTATADAKDEELPANNVFVLRQEGEELETIGELRGLAPEEQIYAARFLGEKGYLVTFEQIDPLFTIDLSDPTQPTLVGELKVPGYSSYLHPLGEDHVLAVGMDGTEDGAITGFAISLFDVSDFAEPKRVAQLTVESDEWSWSDALYDHHAFTFHDGVLSVPLYTYTYDDATGEWDSFSGLWVVEVDEQAGTLTELGRVDHADLVEDSECLYEEWYGCEDYYWYAWMRRSVVIEGGLYSLSDYGIKVNELRSPEEEIARVLFRPAE